MPSMRNQAPKIQRGGLRLDFVTFIKIENASNYEHFWT